MAGVVGYRFHPNNEEIVSHYLRLKNSGKDDLVAKAINEVNICDHDPWELPSLSKIQPEDEDDEQNTWFYFSRSYFSRSDPQFMSSERPKRKTKNGYWKPTGIDRNIRVNGEVIGFKKTLVFYRGQNPRGVKTSWVMHEYHPSIFPPNKGSYVVCKLKNKAVEKNPMPSSDEAEGIHHPPPPDSENHWSIDSTSEVTIQGEESVLNFHGLDFQLDENDIAISRWGSTDLTDFANSFFAEQHDGFAEDNTKQPLIEPFPRLYPENTTKTDADTFDSWGVQDSSRSVTDDSTMAKKIEQWLNNESSPNLGFPDSLLDQEQIAFASKECSENSPSQISLLEKEEASGEKMQIETPTRTSTCTGIQDSVNDHSEFISNHTESENTNKMICEELSKDTNQMIYEEQSEVTKQMSHEESSFNSKTCNPSRGRFELLIEFLLECSRITVSLTAVGVSLNGLTSRIPRLFGNSYSSKTPYPIGKRPNLVIKRTSSTTHHCNIAKGLRFPASSPDRKHLVARLNKHRNLTSVQNHATALQIKFKHMKRTPRGSNRNCRMQKMLRQYARHAHCSSSLIQAESVLKHPILHKRVPALCYK